MAFCTVCGANVNGTFCSQCGTPAAGAAPAQPPQAQYVPPAQYAQPVPVGVPVARKTSPIVWVLVIVLGLFVVGGVAAVGVVAFVAHRARQAGLGFDRGPDGGFSIQARGADGKDARVEFGTKGKLPSWVPEYPGSQPAFSIKGTGDGGTEGGNFTFTTSDSVSQVKTFYQEQCDKLGLKAIVQTTSDDGGTISATDDGANRRSLNIVVGGTGMSSGRTAVNVTYASK